MNPAGSAPGFLSLTPQSSSAPATSSGVTHRATAPSRTSLDKPTHGCMPIPTTAPPQRHHELLCGTQATALRGYDPVEPQARGQQPGQGGDHGAVGPVRPGAGNLAAQDGDLLPEHQ